MKRALWLSALLSVLALGASPGSAQTRAAPTESASPAADYVVGPEDVLDIQVWGSKDLEQPVFVRPDGRVSLPLVGEIAAAGRTVHQLQDLLSGMYGQLVKGAVVTVIVKEIKSRPVYFIGGFGNPGALQLTRDLTLLQAVSVVGGIAPNADGEKGFLLRGDKKIPIDFIRLIQQGDLSQNPRLQPGDSFVVPLADAVYVTGEVGKPGAVKYTEDLTVLRAIAQAGGLTPISAAGGVEILRGSPEKRERLRIDVDRIIASPDESPDVRLQPNDIVSVPQKFFSFAPGSRQPLAPSAPGAPALGPSAPVGAPGLAPAAPAMPAPARPR